MDPNSNPIPEEILFNIFTMLPVKSLCRFRCVSKQCLSIICDSNFIAAHLSRSKSRPKLLISVTKGWNFLQSSGDEMSFYSIDYPGKHHDQSSILHATAHGSIKSPSIGVISSSTIGLICCNCYRGIRFGNPITGKFNLIKYPAISDKKFTRSYIGFDSIDKKKLVILKLENDTDAKSSVLSVMDSQWQWHDTPHQPFILAPNESAICMNGVIYLPVDESDNEFLCAFDVVSECFELIQGPPDSEFIPGLVIEYKGRIALVSIEDSAVGSEDYGYGHTHMNEIKLWILEDLKKHSWSFKSFLVPCRENICGHKARLFGATHRGELVFATNLSRQGSFNLFLLELDTDILRSFCVDGFGSTPLPREARVDVLIESLLSPKKINSSIFS